MQADKQMETGNLDGVVVWKAVLQTINVGCLAIPLDKLIGGAVDVEVRGHVLANIRQSHMMWI